MEQQTNKSPSKHLVLELGKIEIRSGIYFLYQDGVLQYIGQARNITKL